VTATLGVPPRQTTLAGTRRADDRGTAAAAGEGRLPEGEVLGDAPGVIAHANFLDESNVAEIGEMTFVFLSIDDGPAKGVIVRRMKDRGIPFVDVGMGLYEVGGSLAGPLRITVSTGPAAAREAARARISFGHGTAGNEYGKNIQIADLNALNAALAVIACKKMTGFYNDLGRNPFSTYLIDAGSLLNEDGA
jgi:hypothetical protein